MSASFQFSLAQRARTALIDCNSNSMSTEVACIQHQPSALAINTADVQEPMRASLSADWELKEPKKCARAQQPALFSCPLRQPKRLIFIVDMDSPSLTKSRLRYACNSTDWNPTWASLATLVKVWQNIHCFWYIFHLGETSIDTQYL